MASFLDFAPAQTESNSSKPCSLLCEPGSQTRMQWSLLAL